MSALRNLPNELGLALGHPAQNEEGRSNLVLFEKPEDHARRVADATRDRLPAGGRKDRPQILYLKPVLNIEGHQTGGHSRRYPIWRNTIASRSPGKDRYPASDMSRAMGLTEPA